MNLDELREMAARVLSPRRARPPYDQTAEDAFQNLQRRRYPHLTHYYRLSPYLVPVDRLFHEKVRAKQAEDELLAMLDAEDRQRDQATPAAAKPAKPRRKRQQNRSQAAALAVNDERVGGFGASHSDQVRDITTASAPLAASGARDATAASTGIALPAKSVASLGELVRAQPTELIEYNPDEWTVVSQRGRRRGGEAMEDGGGSAVGVAATKAEAADSAGAAARDEVGDARRARVGLSVESRALASEVELLEARLVECEAALRRERSRRECASDELERAELRLQALRLRLFTLDVVA